MICLGAVIVGLCGLCTLNVARNGGAYGLEYIFGGLPILGGGAMIAKGILDLLGRSGASE